jgi:hypothetical protein
VTRLRHVHAVTPPTFHLPALFFTTSTLSLPETKEAALALRSVSFHPVSGSHGSCWASTDCSACCGGLVTARASAAVIRDCARLGGLGASAHLGGSQAGDDGRGDAYAHASMLRRPGGIGVSGRVAKPERPGNAGASRLAGRGGVGAAGRSGWSHARPHAPHENAGQVTMLPWVSGCTQTTSSAGTRTIIGEYLCYGE